MSGPSTPVAGATVEIDRLVGDQVASADVTTARNGTWSLGGVLGGRYRIRAWKVPSLAMTAPVILFVGGLDSRRVDLQTSRFSGPTATASYNPYPALQGQPTAVRVEVSRPTVSAVGRVDFVPTPMVSVSLDGVGGWTVGAPARQRTGAAGTADFVATCLAVGQVPLRVIVSGRIAVTLPTPACVAAPPPAPTTTAPASTTTTSPGTTVGPTTTLPAAITTTVPPTTVPPTTVPPTTGPPTTLPPNAGPANSGPANAGPVPSS